MNEIYYGVVSVYKDMVDVGYDFTDMNAADVAENMLDFTSKLDDIDLYEVSKCIVEYRGY